MQSDDANLVQTLKVAVAIAVLRNKPQGISGRRYAEILCERFKAGQHQWKQQYEKAETEILHLKQQLLMQAQTQPDDKLLEDSLLSDSQPIFPTPPPSGSTGNSQTDRTKSSDLNAEVSLGKHTEFLHHVINIKTASRMIALKGNLQDITKQSLLHSLQLLQNHIDDDTLSWGMQKQCVQCINALVEKCDKHLADAIVEKVSGLCTSIRDSMMSSLKQDHKVLEHKCQLLVTFGECRHFTATVLHLLCDTVQAYSEDLRDCVKNEKLPESKRFCNSYYIFWTVEHCLGKMDKLNSEEKLNIKNKLEDSLLYITEQFPLFAHAVWRICGLIS